MKRVVCALVALLPTCVWAQTTPNLNLNLPVYGSAGWGTRINQNFTSLDNFLSGVTPVPQITLSGPIVNANQAATKAYVDSVAGGGGSGNATSLQGTSISSTTPTNGQFLSFNGTSWAPVSVSASNATSIQGVGVASTAPTSGQVLAYNGSQYAPQAAGCPTTGCTMTGAITLPSNPTSALQAATKQYVDSATTAWLSGGTMTGLLILSGNPTNPLGAATKQYVDSSAGSGMTGLTGDVTASGPGLASATLASSGVVAGSYSSANITVDAKGRILSASNGTAGGGGGLAYTAPTLNAIPSVSSTAGSGTVINSSFSDDGNNTYDSEPFLLSGPQYMQPIGTATSGANFSSNPIQWLVSYWNGSTAVSTNWQSYGWLGPGTNPAAYLDFYGPPDLSNNHFLIGINGSINATASANYSTPVAHLRGATWNGSASQVDDWTIQGVEGTGANPTSTLTFSHTGSSGTASVQMPSATFVGGTKGINNNGAQWTGGTSLPATCNVGDLFSLTNATSLATTLQRCYPANTWNTMSASGGGSMSGTPSYVADSGAGTGPTVSIVSGSTDGAGWINVTTGTTPAASAGVFTINFGGTYSTVPRCTVQGSNAATEALGNTGLFVPPSSSTTTSFVAVATSTALTASKAYQWAWQCQL